MGSRAPVQSTRATRAASALIHRLALVRAAPQPLDDRDLVLGRDAVVADWGFMSSGWNWTEKWTLGGPLAPDPAVVGEPPRFRARQRVIKADFR